MKRIMTVDDSVSHRLIVSLVLRDAGYEVIEAVDGADALTKLNQERGELDLLLTDVNMPGMDGLELTRRVRTMPAFEFIPIVVLTGTEPKAEEKKQVRAAGATSWIEKPLTPDRLLALVKSVLS